MQVLYVVEFDVAPWESGGADPGLSGFSASLSCVAAWLSYMAGGPVSAYDLSRSGDRPLGSNYQGGTRTAMWEVAKSDGNRAVRVQVRDDDLETGGSFLTRVTVGEIDSQVTVRVSMARETPPVWLSPIPSADLRQPGIVHSLLGSDELTLSVKSQVQDGRYLQIRSDAEIEELVAALASGTRLPLVLIHTRTLPALSTARTAAAKLVGLARVVTLDYRASQRLDLRLPGYAPPYAGARLVWSDPSAPTVVFGSDRVNGEEADWLRAQLIRLLAPVSVLARGFDHAYREARRAELAERQNAARARSEEAAATGDKNAQIAALAEQLHEAQENAREWEELATQAEERANQFLGQTDKIAGLEQQVVQLNVALLAAQQVAVSAIEAPDDPWDSLPPLQVADERSAQALYLQLQDVSEGRIVFTDRAATSWKKAKYPFPDEMRESLIKLAHLAVRMYDGSARSMPRLDEWIRENFDLKISLRDDTIEKANKLRNFSYEGNVYDRTPHVKVRDFAPHQQVGRIHFALDPELSRLIVDHVGVKLY